MFSLFRENPPVRGLPDSHGLHGLEDDPASLIGSRFAMEVSMKNYLRAGTFLMGSLVCLLMNAGCVSTTLPLASNHPGRVDAPGGRVESEPAAILRPDAPLYSSEDLTAPRGEESRDSEQVASPEGTREAPYIGQGVIQRIGEGQLEIRHQAIPGFMGAMTMVFSVDEKAMDDSFEIGNEIIFRIEVHPEHGYQIFRVDVVTVASDQTPTHQPEHQQSAPGPTGSPPSRTARP
jgi:hypothetical protein